MSLRRRSSKWLLLTALLVLACFPSVLEAFASPPAHTPEPAVEPEHAATPTPAPEQPASDHASQPPSTHGLTFVTPPAHPTDVGIGLFLVGLTEVDPPSEGFPKFTGEFFLELEWNDPRLAGLVPADAEDGHEVFLEHEAELMLERIWWPDIEFENEQGHRHIENRELIISVDGTVDYRERFSGVFRSTPDLRRFPFDTQNFSVEVESFSWDESAVVFHVLEQDIGFTEGSQTLEWTITDASAEIVSALEVRSPKSFSKFHFHIHAERDSGYYMTKVIIPLMLIIVFNWAIFWMPGEPASVRLERGFVGLLTIVAFHQVVSQYLPRIGYMTFMDAVVYIAFLSIGLTMMLTMYAQRLEYTGRPEQVIRIDRIAQVAFPTGFALAMIALWIGYHG